MRTKLEFEAKHVPLVSKSSCEVWTYLYLAWCFCCQFLFPLPFQFFFFSLSLQLFFQIIFISKENSLTWFRSFCCQFLFCPPTRLFLFFHLIFPPNYFHTARKHETFETEYVPLELNYKNWWRLHDMIPTTTKPHHKQETV